MGIMQNDLRHPYNYTLRTTVLSDTSYFPQKRIFGSILLLFVSFHPFPSSTSLTHEHALNASFLNNTALGLKCPVLRILAPETSIT